MQRSVGEWREGKEVKRWYRGGWWEYKWGALSCTSLGALLAAMNGASLIVALPALLRNLHTGIFGLVWVLLSYLLVQTTLTLMAGRLSDMIGRKKLYVGGFAVFTAVSLLAGFAQGAGQLIVARSIMGAAGAFMMANSSVIVTDAFPPKQLGRALGVNMMVAAAGSTLGVVVGGVMTEISWRWVFWFNVPLGLLGTVWAAVNLRELVRLEKEQKLDLVGNATFLIGFAGLLVALTQGGIRGWEAPVVVGGFALAATLLPAFLVTELRARDPLLDLSLFRSRTFTFGNASALLNSLARFAVNFLFVFFFIGVGGHNHLEAGIMLIPLAGTMFVAAPVAGHFADRLDARAISTAGMIVSAVGLLGMGTLIEVNTPYWQIALWQAVVGVGAGVFNSPNSRSIMNAVKPGRRGIASGTRTLLTNAGAVLSIAFAISIVTDAIPRSETFEIFSGSSHGGLSVAQAAPFISGFHTALLAMAAASLLGAILSAARGKNNPRIS